MSDLKKSLKLVANLDQHNSLIIHQNQNVLSIFRGAVRHEQSEKNCLLTTHTIVLANSIDDKKTLCSTHHHDLHLPALLHALFVILNFLCVWSEVNPEQSKG